MEFEKQPRKYAKKAGFTLVELLVVVGLLGALALTVIPRVTVSRSSVWNESLVPQEMSRIRQAFDAFVCDCVPTSNDLVNVAATDLAILMEYDSDQDWSFPESYDAQRCKGWRGPYLTVEGVNEDRPVIWDPCYSDELTNHYYRVDQSNTVTQLVFIGVDDEIDTADDLCCELYRN